MKGRSSTAAQIRWIGISQVWRLLLQFATVVILSRTLSVRDFGLMTMASVVIMFAELFSGMGLTAALVQREKLTSDFLCTVFWSNFVIGVAIGGVVAISSPMVANIFNEPGLIGILTSLAFVFPVSALGSSQLALLERNFRFRNVAQAEVLATTVGLCTALGLAWSGAGVYSLVGQALVTSAFMTVQFWLLSRWRPAVSWRRNDLRGVVQFGRNLVGFNVINYFARNADNILIGKFLGSSELGIYNLAFRLMYLPTQTLTYAINRVIFPVYSEKIRGGTGVANYFLRTVSLVALAAAPMSFGLWAIREPFIDVLLGPQWSRSSAVLTWLAPVGFLQALLSTTGSVFMADGRTDLLLKLGAINTAILVTAFAVGVRFGIVTVAAAYLCSYAIAFALGFYVAIRHLKLSMLDFIQSICAPVLCALVMCGIVSFANHRLEPDMSAVGRMFVVIPLGAATYTGLIAIFARKLFIDLVEIINIESTSKS